MLIVYRHELRLGAAAVAGLFLVYALTLIPGLLIGGPASDRFGRRPVVLPFVVLSPLATLQAPDSSRQPTQQPRDAAEPGRWPPAAVRNWRFWLAVAPASPLVFGSVSLAIVVLPEDVTSARTLSAGFAGLMTALAFSAGVGVQPVARRLGNPLAGIVAGPGCAAAGAGVGVAAVARADRVLAGIAAVLLGLAYGLCLVSGLRQAEQMAGPGQRGAVVAC
jgi:hypothetical protein